MGIVTIVLVITFIYFVSNKVNDKDKTSTNKTTQTDSKKDNKKTKSDLPSDAKVSDWNLVLVNKFHPLKEEINFNHVDVTDGKTITVDERIKEALEAFMQGARDNGYDVEYVSGYRSIEDQTAIYNNSIEENMANGMSEEEAKEATESLINPPGSSEHATGLAVDIAGSDALAAYPALQAEMNQFDSQKWLIDHAVDYGFILRYPQGEEAKKQTGIDYEAWHFRYVGKENAKYIKDKKITLEQYIKDLEN